MCFLVALIGQFVDIELVRALTNNSAKELISGNVPTIFWQPDVTPHTLLPVASIDGGHILLLHLAVALVREVAQCQSQQGNVAHTC